MTGYASGNYGQLMIDGQIVPAIGARPAARADDGYLTMLAGRAPAAQDEIALGAQTLRALHARSARRSQVTVEQIAAGLRAAQRDMRITGVAVLPAFGRGSFSPTDLGTGAVIDGLATVTARSRRDHGCTRRRHLLQLLPAALPARHRPDRCGGPADRGANQVGSPIGCCMATSDQRPGDIKDYAAIRDTPLVLGGVLVLLAVGTLAHVLVTGVRRRRRDLAVLKTLGLVRSQVLRVVAWQASALAGAALLVGLPLGVLAGRWAWALFAGVGRGLRRGRRPGGAGAGGCPGYAGAGQPDRRRAGLGRRPAAARFRPADRVSHGHGLAEAARRLPARGGGRWWAWRCCWAWSAAWC